MSVKKLCGLLLILSCLGAFLAPRRAAAMDTTQTVYVAMAGLSGAVGLVVLIAVMMTDRDDPEFFNLQPSPRRQPAAEASAPVRFGPRCTTPDGVPALACW